MASIAKLFQFTFTELCILVEAWFIFLKWDLLISFTQYKYWRSELNGLNDSASQSLSLESSLPAPLPLEKPLLKEITALIKLSETAGRFHVRKMNCLRRCLTQQKMLVKRGYKTQMHIGVRFEEQKLKAHAWLTLQGKVINDTDDVSTRYSELKAINEQDILRHFK